MHVCWAHQFRRLPIDEPTCAVVRSEVVAAVENSCSQMHGLFLHVNAVYKVTNAAVEQQYRSVVQGLHAVTGHLHGI
jgi:hypothetical protein